MKFLDIIQVIVSVLLIVSILLQNRGGGLSSLFGGQSSVFQVKRGAEKFIFISTIVLSVIFFSLGLARLLV